MITIGIVGVPAGGKSTVAAHLQAKGATWLNADRIAHRCLAIRSVRQQIAAHFGPQTLDDNGFVDRSALARQVFGADDESRDELKYLESIVHPPTRQVLYRLLVRSAWRAVPAAVLDVPLLFESGWGLYCDAVWCLDTPLEQRLQWLSGRGWTAEQLLARERRQLSLAEKRRLSTDIIVNDGDQQKLITHVEHLWMRLMTRRANRSNGEHCRPNRR